MSDKSIQNASVNLFLNPKKGNLTSSRSPEDVESEPMAKKTRSVHKTIVYDESIANQ